MKASEGRSKYGWWCPWCSVWVAEKDTATDGALLIHVGCGKVVERRVGMDPVPGPVSPEVLAQQRLHAVALADIVMKAK